MTCLAVLVGTIVFFIVLCVLLIAGTLPGISPVAVAFIVAMFVGCTLVWLESKGAGDASQD